MGSPQSPERNVTEDGKNGTAPLDPLAESRRLASEFERAVQRNAQADHVAGLADYGELAQGLIARCGRDNFLSAILEVRAKGGTSFEDVIHALIPSARERAQFRAPILEQLQQERPAPPAASAHADGEAPHPHEQPEEADSAPKQELSSRWSIHSMLRIFSARIARIGIIADVISGRKVRRWETAGPLPTANFHFTSLRPQLLDEQGISEELRQSGDDLHRLGKTEEARFSAELLCLSVQAEDVAGRLNEEIARVRERVYAQFSSQYAKLSHDLPILIAPLSPSEQQPRSVLESAVGKAVQRMNIAALERAKRTLDHAMEQEIARQTEELRMILGIIPRISPLPSPTEEQHPQTQQDPQRRNGKQHSGSHKHATAPAPVTGAAE
jgi:hypothetical protein